MALGLGLRSFGGPVAHLGYFREEYVGRRRWLSDRDFAELVGVTSLLPGPSSSQLGVAIGAIRAGRRGALAAWVGFTLPSAVVMTALGLGLARFGLDDPGVARGLALVTVVVVAAAVLGMRSALAPDARRLTLAVAGLALALVLGGWLGQLAAIALGAAGGAVLLRSMDPPELGAHGIASRCVGLTCLAGLVVLLVGLPVLAHLTGSSLLDFSWAFVRAGAFVFGGGHVILPVLQTGVVDPGWVSQQDFLAGYGAAQALPGPLSTFAAYLGAAAAPAPGGLLGAGIALIAVFLPGMLALGAALALWGSVRRHPSAHAVGRGVAAAVVGLLAAALWDPVVQSAVRGVADVVALGLLLLLFRVLPVWAVVAVGALGGAILL